MSGIALENYTTPLLIAPARQDVEFRFLSGEWGTAPRPWRFILEFEAENPPIIGDALIFTYAGEDITLNFVNTEVQPTDIKHFAEPETWIAYCVRFLNKLKNLDVITDKFKITGHLIKDDKFRIYFEDKVIRTTDFNVDGDDWVKMDSGLRLGYSFKRGYSIEDNETSPLEVELSVWDGEKMMMLAEMSVPFIKEPAYSHIFNVKGYLLDILEYFYERNLAYNLPDLSAVTGKEFPDVCRRYGVLSSIGSSALYFEGFALLGGYSSVSRAGYFLQDTLSRFAEPVDLNDDFMFLTNQKLEKEVTLTQPEFLYFLVREDYTEEWGNYNLSLVIQLYYTDGSDEPAGRNVVISNRHPAVYGSPSGYSVIEDLLDDEKTLLKWTAQFRLVNQALTESLFVSPVMTYYPVAEGFHDRYFLFRNGLGGWDTFRTVGKLSKKIDLDKKLFDMHATNSAMIDVRDYSPALKDKYTVVIDSLTAEEADYYRDFFLSRYKYWLVDGKLVRIALLSGDIGIYDERELLHVVQFEFVTDRVLMSVGIESFSEIDDYEIEPWEGDDIEDDDEGGGGGPLV